VKKPAGLNLENINLQKTIPEKFLGLSFEEIFFGRILQVENLTMKSSEPLLAEIESFVRCIEQNTRPEVTGEDGLKAIEIATLVLDDIKRNLDRVKAKI
jgi:predicted dehydrogenase